MTLLQWLVQWLTAGCRPPWLHRLLWAIIGAIKRLRRCLSSRDRNTSEDRYSAIDARFPRPSFPDADVELPETCHPVCTSLEANITGTGRDSHPNIHETDGLVEEAEEAEKGAQV
jgi:hypothetical protein